MTTAILHEHRRSSSIAAAAAVVAIAVGGVFYVTSQDHGSNTSNDGNSSQVHPQGTTSGGRSMTGEG
jgi:hypothetical protein